MRLSRKTVLKHYAAGVKEWSDVIERFDNLDSIGPEAIPKDKVEDDLASRLNSVHMDIEEDHPRACSHPKINPNRVELYRCSWCGNPSAVLRKCQACGLTRLVQGYPPKICYCTDCIYKVLQSSLSKTALEQTQIRLQTHWLR